MAMAGEIYTLRRVAPVDEASREDTGATPRTLERLEKMADLYSAEVAVGCQGRSIVRAEDYQAAAAAMQLALPVGAALRKDLRAAEQRLVMRCVADDPLWAGQGHIMVGRAADFVEANPELFV